MMVIRRSRCTECDICMAICSWSHFGEQTTKRSRIWVQGRWPKSPEILVCLGCKDHECVAACPTGALRWDGWVRLDRQACDTCGVCRDACPVGGIRLDPVDRFPLVCDTCQGQFQCVQWCPTHALERKSKDD